GWGWGGGWGSPYYSYSSPYYGSPYYGDDDYYDDGPTAVQSNGSGRDASYCQQRFKSYDVRSGTYLGHDGKRHRCP
ncbi:BA14K family protein, partial [Nitrobacter vulgaris]